MQAVINDLLRERSQCRFDGCGGGHDGPNGCGDTRGHSFREYGSHDRRSRKQASSCGGPIKFCLLRGRGTSLRCTTRYGLPGPPRFCILLDSGSQWSQVPSAIPVEEGTVDPTSTVAASEGAIVGNLVDFRGLEQATRVDSETGSVRSEPHVQGRDFRAGDGVARGPLNVGRLE